MTCKHGMFPGTCALCNGTVMERPEFHGARPVSDEPRFVKGRDKAEWQGIGRSQGQSGPIEAQIASAAGSLRGPWQPRSAWAREQAAKSFKSLPADVQALGQKMQAARIIRTIEVLSSPPPDHTPITVAQGAKEMDCDTRISPAKNRTPAIPDGIVPSKWNTSSGRHKSDSESRMKHARKASKAAQVIHSRTRV